MNATNSGTTAQMMNIRYGIDLLSLTYDALELHVQCVHYQVMIRLQVHITSKGLEGVSLSETSMNYATSCTIGQN